MEMDKTDSLILPYTTEFIEALNNEENRIRTESILAINSYLDLKQHVHVVDLSLKLMLTYFQHHKCKSDNETVLLQIGARLFNSTALALQTTLNGYYQGCAHYLRDTLETGFLCDYFAYEPDQILVWSKADTKLRLDKFSPNKIRDALDKRDGFHGKKRRQHYSFLSEYGTHLSYGGIGLISPDNLTTIGPFFNARFMRGGIEELARIATISTSHWQGNLDVETPNCLLAWNEFYESTNKWWNDYQKSDTQTENNIKDS
jgi:hypothetical protein